MNVHPRQQRDYNSRDYQRNSEINQQFPEMHGEPYVLPGLPADIMLRSPAPQSHAGAAKSQKPRQVTSPDRGKTS
jgi:hypothetical protein